MTRVEFFEPSFNPPKEPFLSVIACRFGKEWLYIRHHGKETWEMPGGHIESGETADEAARRELTEETGASEFSIECIATYSVHEKGKTGFGRLYLAEINKTGPVPDTTEIAEIRLIADLPGNLTYPEIQQQMFREVISFLKKRNRL